MSSSPSVTVPSSTLVTSSGTLASSSAPANTCPPGGNSVPEPASLPIPHDVRVAIVPGTNTSAQWMVTCCAPNAVNLVEGCYLYCVAPDNMTNSAVFAECLQLNGRNLNESKIVVMTNDAPTFKSPTMSVMQLGMLALAVSCISSLVFSA